MEGTRFPNSCAGQRLKVGWFRTGDPLHRVETAFSVSGRP